MNPSAVDRTSFEALIDRVQACHLCPTMVGRRRVFSPANGSPSARIMFVAEAPGRLGGDRSGIPLTSDQTGRNFERLLVEAGIFRSNVFITNAVLCNPRSATGCNRPPSTLEVRTCSSHLQSTIEIVNPAFVIALGSVALRALASIEPHEFTLRADVGQVVSWWGRKLIPLYHPGPRAQLHRSFELQAADFRRLATTIERI